MPLFRCLNIVVVSHQYPKFFHILSVFSHMRSLTQSSAGPIPNVVLVAPTPVLILPPSTTSLFHPPTSHLEPSIPHSQTLLTPQSNPFFNINDDSLLLSQQARSQVSQSIQCSWADATIRHYSGAIKQFIRFCDTEQVPEHLRFPADEFVLCAFAASSLRKHVGGTSRSRLTAFKAWHTSHNVEWKGSTRLAMC